MNRFQIIILISFMWLTGCSQGSGTTAPAQTPQVISPAAVDDQSFTATSSKSESQSPTIAVDPEVVELSQEEQESELRSSIFEVNTLIKHIENSGLDSSDLSEEKNSIEQQLQTLIANSHTSVNPKKPKGSSIISNDFKTIINRSLLASIKQNGHHNL